MKWLPLVILTLGACKETDTVHLTFGTGASATPSTAATTPIGFRCRDAAGKLLASRGISARSFHAALLIDFIALDGLPSCRPTDIALWCAGPDHQCQVITDDSNATRVCFEETLNLEVGEDAVKAMGDVLTDFQGMVVTPDGPHLPVLIRAVATAQTCGELSGRTPYDVSQLIGCVLSCPVQLDDISGDVLLELPTLSDQCEAGVDACAMGMFNQ